jgi:molecular chaperone HtpG
LEDKERYPTRRDVADELVNVQFAAILLRLGDLLDMSHDRACPLLLSAACPLPPESLAQWSQYQRISHFLAAPDVIEIHAECENQEEHRFLADWCQWLVKEAQNASVLMSRAMRHSGWHPPLAHMAGPEATIRITPRATAKYIPLNWKFEIDPDAVLTRLIEDVYEDPVVFVRELIQNALDATRCQMQLDLEKDGATVPDLPTQVVAERRARYPVRIRIEAKDIRNNLSGQDEKRHVFIIEDCGIGMDKEVIQRYFLQVGRSYYTTADFQRRYRFIPTSRFGVGFLSVFGASDRVTVETYKPSSPDGALSLSLSGPRNYLLIEQGRRRTSGTRIEVLLRTPLVEGEVTKAILHWCRKLEFPVIINDLGIERTIVAEMPRDFEYEIPDVTDTEASFAVRHFDVNRAGIEGELYVFARRGSTGESWASWAWANYSYPTTHPQAARPPFPENLTCINGLTQSQYSGRGGPMASRLDFRDGSQIPVLGRDARRRGRQLPQTDPRIVSRWEEILLEHLQQSERASGKNRWKYIQALVDDFDIGPFWDTVPRALRVVPKGGEQFMSLAEVIGLPRITTIARGSRDPLRSLRLKHRSPRAAPGRDTEPPLEIEEPLIEDPEAISSRHRQKIFERRSIERTYWTPGGLALEWSSGAEKWEPRGPSWTKPLQWAALPDPYLVAVETPKTLDSTYSTVVFNIENELIQWLRHARGACSQKTHGLRPDQYESVREMLFTSAAFGAHNLPQLTQYLAGWRQIPGLPAELYPPSDPTAEQFFVLNPDER